MSPPSSLWVSPFSPGILLETLPVYLNRAVPNALRREGKTGLLVGLYSYKVLLSKPRRAAKKKQYIRQNQHPNPRFLRMYFTTIICSVLTVPGSRNINTVVTSEKSKISVQLIPGGTGLLVKAQRNLTSHASDTFNCRNSVR